MSKRHNLKNAGNSLLIYFPINFRKEDLDLDAIILNGGSGTWKITPRIKRRKLNLMHIAICRLLEPYGFYEFDF
jgi:hypothetical protein